MNSITDATVSIQTSAESVPTTPPWLGEVVLLVRHLSKQGVLNAINQQVRFARRRFGRYEVIDFVAVLAGLRRKLRTDAGDLLRTPATLGICLHGPVRA